MIESAVLIWAAQAAIAGQLTNAPRISPVTWRCTASSADAQVPIELSGSFPAMSPPGENNQNQLRVTTNVESSEPQFTGSFGAVLTSGVPIMTNYTIEVPRPRGPSAYAVRLRFFPLARKGMVKIVRFDPSGEASTYATGTCITQDGQ